MRRALRLVAAAAAIAIAILIVAAPLGRNPAGQPDAGQAGALGLIAALGALGRWWIVRRLTGKDRGKERRRAPRVRVLPPPPNAGDG